MKHMSLPEKSLIQADINTQLIDNIIVHHTNDPKGFVLFIYGGVRQLDETMSYDIISSSCLTPS